LPHALGPRIQLESQVGNSVARWIAAAARGAAKRAIERAGAGGAGQEVEELDQNSV
jgi:hypothetical protein